VAPSFSDEQPGRSLAEMTEFGAAHWVRCIIRRRLGLVVTRVRHRRVTFGPKCDVRRGGQFLVARGTRVRLGRGCVLDTGFTLENRGRIEVGDRTVFGHHCTIAAQESVDIGKECLIGEMVSIRDHDHRFSSSDLPIIDQGRTTSPVRIGDNVWIGAKSSIGKGVTIGSNTIVGAHSVVTGDLPADCVAVGVPARVIRYRDQATPVGAADHAPALGRT
jgi:acetyltransferase-like isoleucine patch superfamily enzyme